MPKLARAVSIRLPSSFAMPLELNSFMANIIATIYGIMLFTFSIPSAAPSIKNEYGFCFLAIQLNTESKIKTGMTQDVTVVIMLI